ncbi:heavy metal-associated isoprenylated plant protein 30-like [Phoenix dactylifera]|uniref:Heavy metal-associated isoprenylated plant protein 30-like n=1 Tax=Phoenix dactylifera TaxID=42345 RepID=A0A8B9AF74_PHODC|nr:heavy metal-associated isoprenylated plant protein 30-like [Phoenix dactylifera]
MADLQIVPAGKHVEAQHVEMKVPLYSYGCEKKIKKALSHLRGIHSVHVDYHLQKVTVWGICNKYDVLATIRKKRREACFWDQMETEFKSKVAEEEADAEKAPHRATINMHKLRKLRKRLMLRLVSSSFP